MSRDWEHIKHYTMVNDNTIIKVLDLDKSIVINDKIHKKLRCVNLMCFFVVSFNGIIINIIF